MRHTFETYPNFDYKKESPLYYIEFTRWAESDPLKWTLFKRQFLYPDRNSSEYLFGNEVHPWNLGGGAVNEEHPNAMDLNTMSFLKFMVDALNEKVLAEQRSRQEKAYTDEMEHVATVQAGFIAEAVDKKILETLANQKKPLDF